MSFNSKNGVNLKGQFNLKNTDPIDGRYVINNVAEYNALTDTDDKQQPKFLYPGLMFTVTAELTLSDSKTMAPGTYQVAYDGKTVNKVPKFTISPSPPEKDAPGVLGDIIVVVNTGS